MGKSGVESAPDISDPYITPIDGQAITAAPIAIAFAGTALTPGALEKTIDGTPVSLNTAVQLIMDSKTTALETSGAGLEGLIKGAFGARGPFPSVSASLAGGNSSDGTSNVTNTGLKTFRGNAEGLKSGLWRKKALVPVVAVFVFIVYPLYEDAGALGFPMTLFLSFWQAVRSRLGGLALEDLRTYDKCGQYEAEEGPEQVLHV